jgi:hypothetical protein
MYVDASGAIVTSRSASEVGTAREAGTVSGVETDAKGIVMSETARASEEGQARGAMEKEGERDRGT